ncbi:MAG: leucine-rich repeat domain-containing protein [Bacteroidaceae bacterium]|nr:leucine-rich repeat domain-containing protein [Bacteroidaceae bacterium]
MRKFLLLLAITCLTIAAHAALDGNGRRIAPEVESVATSFTTGSEENVYYLYNTSAKLFFTQGNTWGTRGCVGPATSAIKLYFDESFYGYVIHDYVQTESQWMVACVSGGDANTVYTDHDEGWGRPYWRVVPVSGKKFRLQNTQVDEGLFLGRDDAVAQDFNHANSDITDDNLRFPVSADLAPGEGHHIDWVLVSSAAYNGMFEAIAVYEAAEALYSLFAEAEQLGGIDLTTAKALYANEAATVKELNAAATALSAAIETRQKDFCYLIGTDGTLKANHASAILSRVSEGVYEGNVTYSGQFYVATKLAKSAEDWASIDNEVWTGNSRSGYILSVGSPLSLTGGYSNRRSVPFQVETNGTYKTTVDFNKGTILIEDTGTPGPGPGPDPQPTSYINEESKGGCYLLFWAGRNYMDETIFSYTQPSATLNETETKGVFDGYVKFDRSSFTITRALATTGIDIEEDSEKYYIVLEALRPYRFGALEHPISFDKRIDMEENPKSPQDFWMPNYDPSVTYYVKVDFNTKSMAVCTSKDKDPFLSEDINNCYLIETEGRTMATLTKTSNGVYQGTVTFENENQFFYVAKQLNDSEDNWWAGNWNTGRVLNLDEPLTMNKGISEYGNVPFRVIAGGTYKTTVDFNQKTILIEDTDVPDVPDIDLSSGAHFSITLTQPGTLQQRLTNAVFATDYDLVDFLTVKGKMGGADIAYLRAQEGLVSQLQYLDISQVELVYDDEAYYTNTYQTNWGSFGGLQTFQTDVYTLSSENKEEAGGGSFSGAVSNSTTIYRRNNLSLAFAGMKYLRQCKLPKTMEGIGSNILSGCPLDKVTLPTAPTYIWGEAFSGTKLTSFDLPATVEFIGDRAFDGVPIKFIDVSHVTSLGEYCFNNSGLMSVQLNNQITGIPEGLFNGCKKLASITIPTNVKTIGANAFGGSMLTSVTIPESVTEIGASAFNWCEKLSTVTMGNGVRKIGKEAFLGCNKLTTVRISSNIEEIGENAFGSIDFYDDGSDGFYCEVPWMQNQPVENGVIYIGMVAYRYVTGSIINIMEGTVSLADWFGRNSNNITSITLPSTLRILGTSSLSNASISSIELPESLEKIGSSAFARCNKLRRITIPRNVSFIGDYAFGECGIIRVIYNAEDASTGNTYSRPFPESVTRVIIGEGVKVIPRCLFEGCKNLVRVTMASTVEHIGNGAFNTGGSPLQYIDLPSSLKYVGGSNFYGCNTVTAYMKEPFPLTERPSDEEVLNLEFVKRCIEEGDRYDGVETVSTPFGGNIYYHYHIDEQGNLTWGEVSAPSYQDMGKPNTILRVPNGSLAAYKSDPYWPSFFKEIVTFDGASNAETIVESTSVKVADNVTDETDLSGTLVDGIYVTLDTEDSGDGYDATEGCIVINSQTTEEAVTAASADNADDLTVKNQLNGLMFEIPPGKGRITIDCQTLGSRALYIKIGDNDPQAVSLSTRNTVTFNFDVLTETRVLIFAANNTQANLSKSIRRAAYANDDSVKLYGISINIDMLDEDGINTATPATSEGEVTIYDLSGRKITNRLKKGLYIVNGKKTIRL